MTFTQAEAALRRGQKSLTYYNNIRRTLEWDMRVNLPPKAVEYRSECIGFLADQAYLAATSPELLEAAQTILDSGRGGCVLQAIAAHTLRTARNYTAVPRKLHSDYSAHCLKAEALWQEARSKNDFSLFCDTLDASFAFQRQFAAAAGHANEAVTYLLSIREPGMTEERLDHLFDELKNFLLPFLQQIDSVQKAVVPLSDNRYPIDKQMQLCRKVMNAAGFDFDAGRLDESAHPVTVTNQRCDIRITTRFFERNFLPGLLSCCHETGHALYHQNITPELEHTQLNFSPSPGMDEGVARLWENFIGRGMPFWRWLYPLVKEMFPALDHVSLEQLYCTVNAVHISPHRTQSDELTGNLHIILRYEIEKLLLRGEISAYDVPAVWNEKSRLYFGSEPEHDADGCLSDMHWASGFIAYFQSYILANFYAGHFFQRMQVELPFLEQQISQGDFTSVKLWLTDHIFRHGATVSSEELLKSVTEETLSPKPYIEYIRTKYTNLYHL